MGIGRASNSMADLLTDCFRLPSADFIRIADHRAGKNITDKAPINIPAGRKNNDMPTPKVPTTLRVRNNWMSKEMILMFENQNPKKAVSSSSSVISRDEMAEN